MSSKSTKRPKLLVLCVDRDNDIGTKGKIETPIVGRAECLNAGMMLATSDPEEADANTIFGAVKQHDELLDTGYESEVAVVSGLYKTGVEGDQKILSELRQVLKSMRREGVVLVSDGVDDERVVPLIQNIVPVVSIKRIVVRHSGSVEESYMIFARYLKMLFFDPRYSRYSLGVPGFLLVVSGLLIILQLTQQALVVSMAIVGAALIIKGFELDRLVGLMAKLKPSAYIRWFSALASLLIIAAAFYEAFTAMSATWYYSEVVANPSLVFEHGPFLVGIMIQRALTLLSVGLGIYFVGGLLYDWLRQSMRVWRDVVGLVMIIILYLPILQFSLILTGQGSAITLVTWLLIGLAVTFSVVVFVYEYVRSRRTDQVET